MTGLADSPVSALMKLVDLATQASIDLLDSAQMFLRNIEALDGLANDTKTLKELVEQIGCLKTVLGLLRKPVPNSSDINLLISAAHWTSATRHASGFVKQLLD